MTREMELVLALLAVLPYAEQEMQSLGALVRDDDAIADELIAAEEAIDQAYKALAAVPNWMNMVIEQQKALTC
jgi:hypothetical protein